MRSLIKILGLLGTIGLLIGCQDTMTGLLNPKGLIAYEERVLFFDALALMMIVVLPVIIMSFAFILRYRASHKTAEYRPQWSHSLFLELIWWGIPCAIIIILGIMTWHATHKLDPYQSIDGPQETLEIQVITLPWKFLFIYPKEKIATVNTLTIPIGKQIAFTLTSDNAAMASFFIPQLGSQIYTMAGMKTQLHLLANAVGTYRGMNTQYNGEGFSDMHFPVNVVSSIEMDQWVKNIQNNHTNLDQSLYQTLRKPTIAEPIHYYASVSPGLFNHVIMHYMGSNMHMHANK